MVNFRPLEGGGHLCGLFYMVKGANLIAGWVA